MMTAEQILTLPAYLPAADRPRLAAAAVRQFGQLLRLRPATGPRRVSVTLVTPGCDFRGGQAAVEVLTRALVDAGLLVSERPEDADLSVLYKRGDKATIVRLDDREPVEATDRALVGVSAGERR
jgi:hypothetical protein